MAAQSLFSALVYGAIAAVSAAGLAAGTYLKNTTDGRLRTEPRHATETGVAGDRTTWGEELATARFGERAISAPTFSRITIERAGISRLEGRGEPDSRVVVNAAGRAIASATVARNGSWSVVLDRVLPPGEHRLRTVSTLGLRVHVGEDVHVFVPADLREPAIVAYDARPMLLPVGGASATRDRAESLARDASERFDEIMQADEAKDGGASRKAGAPASSEDRSRIASEAGFATRVLEWVNRSRQTYHDVVTRTLAGDADAGAVAEPAAPGKSKPEERVAGAGGKPPLESPGLSPLEGVLSWIDGAGDTFAREVATPLSRPAPAGVVVAEEKDRAAAAADRRRAAAQKAEEEARRFAEERRKADEALRRAKEKAAAEAATPEARKRAEEQARLEAEEKDRARRELQRAAEAAARRTADTEKRFESGLRKLDEAAAAKRAAEAQKAAEAARREYQARRTAAEAEAERLRRKGEAPRTAEPKSAAANASKRESEEAFRRKAAEAEDAAREEEEYRILRRMLAEAERAERAEAKRARSEDDQTSRSTRTAEASDSKRTAVRVGGWSKKRKAARATSCKPRGKRRKIRRSEAYFVQPSDTLWGLARRYYGSGTRYPVIYRANRGRISDPDVLRPCQWIRIPGKRRRA